MALGARRRRCDHIWSDNGGVRSSVALRRSCVSTWGRTGSHRRLGLWNDDDGLIAHSILYDHLGGCRRNQPCRASANRPERPGDGTQSAPVRAHVVDDDYPLQSARALIHGEERLVARLK